ncbi:Uncharacterised protein [Vibrio cholerae]|nr:Uncharacterised protein [Vibrio cholerae]
MASGSVKFPKPQKRSSTRSCGLTSSQFKACTTMC